MSIIIYICSPSYYLSLIQLYVYVSKYKNVGGVMVKALDCGVMI